MIKFNKQDTKSETLVKYRVLPIAVALAIGLVVYVLPLFGYVFKFMAWAGGF